jgi:hypothetical protein
MANTKLELIDTKVVLEGTTQFEEIAAVNELADRVIGAFGEAFSKLSEHKREIKQLWVAFENLQPGQSIKGVTTKQEFAIQYLHRTPRAVQLMLKGTNKAKAKAPKSASALVSLLTGKLIGMLRASGAGEAVCADLKSAIDRAFARTTEKRSVWARMFATAA